MCALSRKPLWVELIQSSITSYNLRLRRRIAWKPQLDFVRIPCCDKISVFLKPKRIPMKSKTFKYLSRRFPTLLAMTVSEVQVSCKMLNKNESDSSTFTVRFVVTWDTVFLSWRTLRQSLSHCFNKDASNLIRKKWLIIKLPVEWVRLECSTLSLKQYCSNKFCACWNLNQLCSGSPQWLIVYCTFISE